MTTAPVQVLLVELHDPESGRLDAQRIAEFLNVPLTRLARATGRKYQSLHKTPAAPAVQGALCPIKRSLDILARVIGDRATILAWVNTPHPDLGGLTPLGIILDGNADVVQDMLEDAMAGMPT